jgi:methionyl aminopeptidase
MAKIKAKTPAEIKLMAKSGEILRAAQDAMRIAAKPGITLIELDKIAEDVIRSHGAKPGFKGFHGFPATICSALNSEVVHGIPDDRIIKVGDLLTLDCGVTYKRMNTDAAFTVIVGGEETNPARAEFSRVTREALLAGMKQAKAGNYVGDIGHAIEGVINKSPYSLCKEYTGHGIGYELHEEPHIFNYGKPKTGPRLVAGMTICLEPIVASANPECKTLSDGWTVVTTDGRDACQWEHCGLVTESGFEIFA